MTSRNAASGGFSLSAYMPWEGNQLETRACGAGNSFPTNVSARVRGKCECGRVAVTRDNLYYCESIVCEPARGIRMKTIANKIAQEDYILSVLFPEDHNERVPRRFLVPPLGRENQRPTVLDPYSQLFKTFIMFLKMNKFSNIVASDGIDTKQAGGGRADCLQSVGWPVGCGIAECSRGVF